MRNASADDLIALVERAAGMGVADIVLRAGSPPRWRLSGHGLTVIPGMPLAFSRPVGELARRLSGQTSISSQVRAGTDLDFRAQCGKVAWRCNMTACAPRDIDTTAEQAATRPRDLCLTLRRLQPAPPCRQPPPPF